MRPSDTDRVAPGKFETATNTDLERFAVGLIEGQQYARVGLALLLHVQQN
jgi:hypothetical protein